MKQVLVVEDDSDLSRGIAFTFEKGGFEVTSASTMHDGLRCFEQNGIDIVILDLNLPDGDGTLLCRKIRDVSNIPVIILTARDLETDEVSGLMAGADDYITKPFSLSVLRARVDAVLRRFDTKEDNFIKSGLYSLDTGSCKLFKNKAEIPVSTTEFRMLRLFMTNEGQVLSKEQILAAIWDNRGSFVDENALSVNISRLRAKIEDDPRNPKTIKTIHGMGYVWLKS